MQRCLHRDFPFQRVGISHAWEVDEHRALLLVSAASRLTSRSRSFGNLASSARLLCGEAAEHRWLSATVTVLAVNDSWELVWADPHNDAMHFRSATVASLSADCTTVRTASSMWSSASGCAPWRFPKRPCPSRQAISAWSVTRWCCQRTADSAQEPRTTARREIHHQGRRLRESGEAE